MAHLVIAGAPPKAAGLEHQSARQASPILARMKIALLKASDKKTITADEAVAKDERRAFCPRCKHPVRLHRCKKDRKPL